MATTELALFDLDGVLIQPGGYRQAVVDTINYFLRQAGLDEYWAPVENELAAFEAQGISAEWDMIPLWLALVLDEMAGLSASKPFWPSWEHAIRDLRSIPYPLARNSWVSRVLRFESQLVPGLLPSLAIFNSESSQPLFSNIQGQGVLAELLANTRDTARCQSTQVFQAFVLGSHEFSSIWKIDSPVSCGSALAEFDQLLLDPSIGSVLSARQGEAKIGYAAFTARPSISPDGGRYARTGYTPEAELALALVPLERISLVGHGTVQYMAEQAGIPTEQYLKPQPFQALAGFAAASGNNLLHSLQWAEAIINSNNAGLGLQAELIGKPDAVNMPSRFTAHVFEDSPNGIRSAISAARMLEAHGILVSLRIWGIAENTDKKAALEALGAAVFPDVNQAIKAAWPKWF